MSLDKINALCYQATKQGSDKIKETIAHCSSPPLSLQSSSDKSLSLSKIPGFVWSLTSDQSLSDSFKVCPRHVQKASSKDSKPVYCNSDTLIASLWDFAGQVIFHNSHSLFISDSGVILITFNASMELTDKIIPHKGCRQPPECCTTISSIHYWLQVVNSVCSVKENVLLVGTHIDKLHHNLKKAREIATKKILPELEKELSDKPYAQHIAGIGKDLKSALEQSCFFVTNKYPDEEIESLKDTAVRVATPLREGKPLYFLKIEQALLQVDKKVISRSKMVDLVAENAHPLGEDSEEFKGILEYFHNNRTILYFNQIKDLVILSPNWLAKLFSYVIAAESYKTESNYKTAYKWLTKCGVLHESLLQHMLDKFQSDYPIPSINPITKKQVVDILLCFHLVAQIDNKAWFGDEETFPLPESGDTFIVPSLVPADDERNPPQTEQERIVYFMFNTGFIPTSLLNQLIAECVCRSVRRNDRLLW